MSHVFLSYKSENVDRVVRLARGLEAAGLPVWWDRHLASGENWSSQIQSALDCAQCVVVVWTHESVGPAGDFVRDEARLGKKRGLLVPVKLDEIDLPPGFGEVQAVDLTRWKGRVSDPFFQDLLTAVRAKMEGRAVPPAKGPMKRLTRRLTYGSLVSALGLCIGAFGSNTFRIQEQACSMSLLQPYISDGCGAAGLGGRPSKLERVAWEGRKPGSCADLRAYMERFPKGAYHAEAQSLLAARQARQTESWSATEHRLTLFQPQSETPSPNKNVAQAVAVVEAKAKAERLCRGFAVTSFFRFKSTRVDPQEWKCDSLGNRITCGFEGEAVCQLEKLAFEETETCGHE
jgi:hypothetical protein